MIFVKRWALPVLIEAVLFVGFLFWWLSGLRLSGI